MKKYFTNNKKILGYALLSWVIPFLVSVPFVNPETGEYYINPVLFHATLFLTFIFLVFFFFKKLKNNNLLNSQAANTFLAINIILDIIVLVVLIKLPFLEWLITILPAYIIGIFGVKCFLNKK